MMDPKANIEEQRALAYKIANERDDGYAGSEAEIVDMIRLAELVLALDQWRASGGFDPYVETWDGVPSREQGVAFAQRMARANTLYAHVARGGAGLPDDYLYVIEEPHDPTRRFEYGIDREGIISS